MTDHAHRRAHRGRATEGGDLAADVAYVTSLLRTGSAAGGVAWSVAWSAVDSVAARGAEIQAQRRLFGDFLLKLVA